MISLHVRADALPNVPPRRRRLRSSGDDRAAEGTDRSVAPRAPLTRPTSRASAAALSGVRIVVVDDDSDTLGYFNVALRTYGATVAGASNAVDGLRLISDGTADIVLTDIAMPDHDGYWLVRQLRDSSDPRLSQLPVIATTAYGREHSRGRALGAGFTEHLPKPVDPLVLRDTIVRLAGPRP